MKRKEIIERIKDNNYFEIRELVCPHTYKTWGNASWKFLQTDALHTLLVLREDILQVPMVINTYHIGKEATQRGLRCNLCPIPKDKTLKGVLYLTAHRGGAWDIVFTLNSGMTAAKARRLIKEKQHLLPCNVRIEKDVTWLHIDVYDEGVKVYEF